MPLTRENDGIRTTDEVRRRIDHAKKTGDWPGAKEQWARAHGSEFQPTVFWDDEKKQPVTGGRARLQLCCQALRVTEQAFVGNALFSVTRFCVLQSIFPDLLHVWLLGEVLHLLPSSIGLIKDWLFRWTDQAGEPVLGKADWKAVLDRLQSRLALFGSQCMQLAMRLFVTQTPQRVDAGESGGDPAQNAANTSAAECAQLLCAMGTVLGGLIDNEVAKLVAFYSKPENQDLIAGIIAKDLLAQAEELALFASLGISATPGPPTGGAGAAPPAGRGKPPTRRSTPTAKKPPHAAPAVARAKNTTAKNPPPEVPAMARAKTGPPLGIRARADLGALLHASSFDVASASGYATAEDEPRTADDRPGPASGDNAFLQAEQRRQAASKLAHLRRYRSLDDTPIHLIQEVWLAALAVYLELRQPNTTDRDLDKLRQAIASFKHSKVVVFPSKSGQLLGWAYSKNHELDYLVWTITEIGNIEASSAQSGERTHQINVKQDCAQTNRHVSKIAQTVMLRDDGKVLITEVLRRARDLPQGTWFSGTEEAPSEGAREALKFLSREEDCLLAAHDRQRRMLIQHQHGRCHGFSWPIEFAATHHLWMERTLSTPGGDIARSLCKGRRVDPYEVKLCLLRSAFEHQHPAFRVIQQQVGLFIWHRVQKNQRTPTAQEVTQCLHDCLVDGKVALWNQMKMTNLKFTDSPCFRLRSYPLPSRPYHGRKRQVVPLQRCCLCVTFAVSARAEPWLSLYKAIASRAVPGATMLDATDTAGSRAPLTPCLQDFCFIIPESRMVVNHKHPTMDTHCARVVQFLSANIRPSSKVQPIRHDLAMVQYLCEFNQPQEAHTPVERFTGQNLHFEPTVPWYGIVDVSRILGPEPVVPCSWLPTIPYHASPIRFQGGQADKKNRPGTGSPLFVRMTMLMKLGRILPVGPGQKAILPRDEGSDSNGSDLSDYDDADD